MSGTISGSETLAGNSAGGWQRNSWAKHALLLAVVLIGVAPLLARGPSCGQDFDFHLESWLDVTRSWQQGVVYPRWDASANFGAGEPRFVFYPPLSWTLGAALGSVMPWTVVPLTFTVLALLGAGWSFRAMAREWMPGEPATLAAALYIVNPYMLFVAYERSAMGELLAAMWVPLLVLYGLRQRRAMLPLAIAVAGIWLTDAPAGVMGSYMLAGLVAVAAIQNREWRLVRRALGAVALGLGLAAFWLVPALCEQRWVQIHQAIGPLMRVEDSFLFGYVPLVGKLTQDRFDVIYHNGVLRTASWIVVALMVSTALAAWCSRRGKSRAWLPLVMVAVAVGGLQVRWSNVIWQIAPELKYLQFPWRWMLVLALIASILAGLALRRETPDRKAFAVRMGVVLAFAGVMAVLASAVFWQACDEEDNVTAQVSAFRTQGFEGTDEYTLKGADESELEGIAPGNEGPTGPVAVVTRRPEGGGEIPARIKILRWQTEHMQALVEPNQPGFAVLRLTDYPAWRVTRNGIGIHPGQRGDGVMVIPVEAGENRIEIRWGTTGDQWAGIGISLAALAITLAIGWTDRRKAQKVPLP